MVCCSESFPFYSHLILTRREGFFPLSTPSSSYLCVCVLPHLCAVLFRVLLFPPEGIFSPFHPIVFLPVGVLPPVCSVVPSAAVSSRRHFFPFPPRRLLTCRCSSTCVQCGSECCCFHQKAFFPLSTPSSSYLRVFFHPCAVLFRVLLRREQVLKVACNHLISTTMELKPMATSETAWCWVATDYTDNQPQVEQFAVKFKVSQEVVLGGGGFLTPLTELGRVECIWDSPCLPVCMYILVSPEDVNHSSLCNQTFCCVCVCVYVYMCIVSVLIHVYKKKRKRCSVLCS